MTDPAEKYLRLKSQLPHVKIVVVTKNRSWNEIEPLYSAGARDFGENRIQEAYQKMATSPADINWHMIGSLQKNKAALAVEKFSLIHSVDSLALAEKMSQVSKKPISILLQVNIDHAHGFSPGQLSADFPKLKELKNFAILGLMTMAPHTEDHTRIRCCFRTLRELRDHLGLKELSMGMSQDWPIAIEEGATIIRIGTYFFS